LLIDSFAKFFESRSHECEDALEHLALGVGRLVVSRGEQGETVEEWVDWGVVDDATRVAGGWDGRVAELACEVEVEGGGGEGGAEGAEEESLLVMRWEADVRHWLRWEWCCWVARSSAVLPPMSCTAREQPCATRYFAVSRIPLYAALCRAVDPGESFHLA
jgi:hypothetical protein